MEKIKVFVEQLLGTLGLSGGALTVTRFVILVVVSALLAWAAGYLCRRLIPLVGRLTRKTANEWDDMLLNPQVLRSACNIVPAIVVWQLLPWVFYEYPVVRDLLARVTAIYITVMATKTVITFVNSLKVAANRWSASSQQYFLSFMGVLKIILIFIAVIIVVAILFNRNPMTIIAGLGATSAILMLVFKDTIEGLVAGIRLTSNEMLHKGDWITVPKAGANGIVEEMSLTTVKIRNFDNTIITVSPKTLVDDSFQNWVGMRQGAGRRVKRLLYIDFRSIGIASEQLKAHLAEKGYIKGDELKDEQVNITLYCRYMERYLRQRKEVNTELTLMVRQLEATNTGLPVEFYFFLKDKEWIPYEHQLADILAWAYALAREFGLVVYEQLMEPKG